MQYHIITYGCQMNKADSERIASALESKGYKSASNSKINEADLVVVNMCSVRQSAVNRVYGLIPKLNELKTKNNQLKTILTGCILKEDKRKFKEEFDLILDIKDLPNWLKSLKNKNSLICHDRINKLQSDYLKVKPKYQNNSLAFVPISNGCNNFCSYCVVPYVRGCLVCRNHQEILEEVKNLAKKRFKEIWLLGQNVNDYLSPTDHSINFSKLLRMIDEIEGNFKILFTSPHPKNFSNELIDILANLKKFGKYLNLPVQSGDDEILRKMKRNYTIKEYKELVKKIRKKIPEIKLSTDIIVGFPGETKKQFENTIKLLKEIKFNNAYIAKYSPRPGTAAFQMKDDVPWEEKKRREKCLRKLLSS